MVIVLVTLLFTTIALVAFVEKASDDLLVEAREAASRRLRQEAYSALEVTLCVLEEFRQTILHELNYEREAQNMITVGENLAQFPLITVPQPVADYSSPSVLTMDYVRGQKVTKLSPLARLDLNGAMLAEQLFRA